MTAPTVPKHDHGPLETSLNVQRQFKKHKALPRPRMGRTSNEDRAIVTAPDLLIDISAPHGPLDSQPSSPRILKHQQKRMGVGPDLPPTPPNYSRSSSGNHPAQTSSPSSPDTVQDPHAPTKRPPATPPDQRSPPTPDVTPPQPVSRPRALRPVMLDRGYSRTATVTTDSRTESFKTAREEQIPSEDEATMSTVKTILASSTPSQTTVLRAPVNAGSQTIQPQALNLALERLNPDTDESYTPRTRGELSRFDGQWGSPDRVEQEWDDNLGRTVSVGRHGAEPLGPTTLQANGVETAIVMEENIVTPTNAARAVRSMSLQDNSAVRSSPMAKTRRHHASLGTPGSEVRGHMEPRGMSSMANPSTRATVIGAILLDSQNTPQRQRTLRHVRKRRELRETSPIGRRVVSDEARSQQPAWPSSLTSRNDSGRRPDSYASTPSTNVVASGRARREVWKTGGIPVVVIPDRKSSHKPKSKEPSLRSTSSRHSRTRSVGSSPFERSPLRSEDFSFERQSRWDQSTSVSDRSEQRTIDFPPTIPARSSSMSAPTSRTTSRNGSLTAESLKALNDIHRQTTKSLSSKPGAVSPTAISSAPEAVPVLPAPPIPTSSVTAVHSPQTPKSQVDGFTTDHLGVDHHDDTASARKYSSRTTPFSIISVETNWTAPEVSEAQAVHMYSHQNSSILMVNHSARPSDTSDLTEKGHGTAGSNDAPKITATNPEGGLVTPEQRQSLEEVDSPLRNPRAPPDPPSHPPAINFIPATPSGLTPAEEKAAQLGNFYESEAEKPSRRVSIVQKALGRRRHSISYPPSASRQPGFLSRAFSLSKNGRKSLDTNRPGFINPDMDSFYGGRDDEPVEQDKLHPHWRPQWDVEDACDCAECRRKQGEYDEVYRYPPIDNRPRPPKRSLSVRMKQTFAILPTRSGTQYEAEDASGPDGRRTIRRTPSGNLRVVRRPASAESLKQWGDTRGGRRPASESNSQKGFWHGYSLRRRPSQGKMRRSSSLSSKLERLPSVSRMWSERRREKRTQELRQMISGPREVRDGVGDVIRNSNIKDQQNRYPRQI